MNNQEIMERLGLSVPKPPKHFTDEQKNNEAPLPVATKIGIGIGSFTCGCKHLVSGFVPDAVGRSIENLGYGYELGKLMSTVQRAKSIEEGAKAKQSKDLIVRPVPA